MTPDPVRVCFVCLGNICRSPTAEGVMRALLERHGLADVVDVDSAGTSGWHVGEPPDERARDEARRRGYALGGAARQFQRGDFARFDYVIAMDRANRDHLAGLRPEGSRGTVHLLRDFEPGAPEGAEVPDPYYGGPDGFAEVLALCERACEGLIAHLRAHHRVEARRSE